jgi:Na+/proline symporter
MRLAAVVAPLLIVVTYVCLLPIGALAHLQIPLEKITDTDDVVPQLLSQTHIFGPILGSLFLLVLASAAMSSLDSVLLVAASSVDHDLIMPPLDDARAVARTRIWVVVISLASMVAALNEQLDIVSVTAFSGSLYGACFLPSLVVGLYWHRRSARAAASSIILGSIVVIAWFIARKLGWVSWHEVYIGLIVGLAVYVGVSMFTPTVATPGKTLD